MPIPFLPNELVDQILSYFQPLSRFHYYTALVCRNWLEPSRKYLYHKVEFSIVKDETSTEYMHPLELKLTRYSRRSWQLLSTVGNDSGLAELVKEVSFKQLSSESEFECSPVFTTTQALISTAMRLPPYATSFRFENDEWFDLQHSGAFFPHMERLQALTFESLYDEDCWGPLSRLPNLRSLELGYTFSCSSGSQPLPPFVSRLQVLCLATCSEALFDALCNGSKTSLRKLKIPLNLGLKLARSQWHNLTHLSVSDSCSNLPSSDQVSGFVHAVSSSCPILIELSLSAIALNFIRGRSGSSFSLPASCSRVNFEEIPSFETALSFVLRENYHPGIRELGLYDDPNRSYSDQTVVLTFFGLRALMEATGGELIWYSEK
ncbi:uncharacterized protein JCM6883_005467 [Sporobolomyces salmoneus]|uniref:uncharacterized protein n=1 Tax=Sporobolomyces salmoneus TaxID=183962 RepID=UPI003181796B